MKNEKAARHHILNQGSTYPQALEQLALNFWLRNTALSLCRKCTFFFISCVFHILCEESERCLIALVNMQTPTRQSVPKFYLGRKKIPPVSQPASAAHNVLPNPKPVPGSEAIPHSLCQQKSRSLICAHLRSDVPPLRGPRLTQASLPAPRLHLQQVPRPRANQQLPNWKKIKVILLKLSRGESVINKANGLHASARSVTGLTPSGCWQLNLKVCLRNSALPWPKR